MMTSVATVSQLSQLGSRLSSHSLSGHNAATMIAANRIGIVTA